MSISDISCESKKQYEGEMILFAPICGRCRNVLYKTVDIHDDPIDPIPDFYEAENGEDRLKIKMKRLHLMEPEITPYRCPYCGAFFDHVVVPTKLPFNTLDFLGR